MKFHYNIENVNLKILCSIVIIKYEIHRQSKIKQQLHICTMDKNKQNRRFNFSNVAIHNTYTNLHDLPFNSSHYMLLYTLL